MKFNAFSRIILSKCLPLICLAGCQGVAPVEIKSLTPPEKKAQGVLLVGDLARSVRKETPDVIGYHTITFFAIRTSPIHPLLPLGMQDAMTEHIKKALQMSGYKVKVVPPGVEPNGPILRGEIRKFWFSSYWWLWPITMVGGDIKLQLILESPDGTRLWEKECKGSAFMILPSFANVDFLIKDAATSVCNQVIESVTSDTFRQILASHEQ